MKAVVVVVVTLFSAAAAQTCEADFDLVGSACYLIPDKELSWNAAMSYCQNIALPYGKMAALARVESCNQFSLLGKYLKDEKFPVVDYWLGGTTTLDVTGTFRWDSTGAEVPMGVPFWFPGQPDFPFIERSLSLSKNGYFADEKEEIAQRFICQLL